MFKKIAVIIKKIRAIRVIRVQKKIAVIIKKFALFVFKKQEKSPKRFAYLCIFALVFSGVLKEPNLRFESASLTSSKRLFEELIKAL